MIDMSETSGEFSDEEDAPGQGKVAVEIEGEMPILPLTPKQEPMEQTLLPVSKQQ